MTSPLGERAPAIRRIREYAQHGPWTARQDGPVRFLGVAFCWTVTIPAVIALRVAEWPFLRPSRFIFTAITVKCLSELPFVEAFVDTVIKPGVERALWLFL
ncbi:hypothetical protein [Micromonospora sp. NPDC005652]|uniref:hypothetical protein n=1 Tax=Micromonospora sp. NPDC005652 TaxID=3157046 RepID=UPI0033F80C13